MVFKVAVTSQRDVGVAVNSSTFCFRAIRKANGMLGIIMNSEGYGKESLWLLYGCSEWSLPEKSQEKDKLYKLPEVFKKRSAKNAIMNSWKH